MRFAVDILHVGRRVKRISAKALSWVVASSGRPHPSTPYLGNSVSGFLGFLAALPWS